MGAAFDVYPILSRFLPPIFQFVCLSVCKTFSNLNITATSGPIVADRNQILSEASLGWGLIALGFGPGNIGTLVSMATNSSHRGIMGEML